MKFVNTYGDDRDIIILVKTPQYIFTFTIPIVKYLLLKDSFPKAVFFRYNQITRT